jgi:hypothetical protein
VANLMDHPAVLESLRRTQLLGVRPLLFFPAHAPQRNASTRSTSSKTT